ncbi:MAG: DNA recombination protein RmuC [Candidatus Shapirobacteria bacterium]
MKAMQAPIFVLIVLAVLVVVVLGWWLSSMQRTVSTGNQELGRRLDNAARLMGEIQKEAGKFAEVSLSMKNLQDYLKSPKLRGNIGEQVLADLIGQIFPKNSFFLQYTFKSGSRVDAAIKTEAGILPIDAKFPAENFQKMLAAENEEEKKGWQKNFARDVKRHIEEIAKKYILPEEGTMDFALMYIPSEPVYYEVVSDLELTEWARRRRVYPVSPNTLYANLQVILLSFEGKGIERKSRQLFIQLRAIRGDYVKMGEALAVLGRHVNNSYNAVHTVESEFTRLGQKLDATKTLNTGPEPEKTALAE